MPVYLFTFHAHGSWMPDRKQGYVQRNRGVLPRDDAMAQKYRARQSAPEIVFEPDVQQRMIDAAGEASQHQKLRLHAIATDPTHAHLCMSWTDDRKALRVRSNLKQSLTRRLNEALGQQVWFSRGASQKRVRDALHLQHLLTNYLPSHRGVCWSENDPSSRDPAGRG